MTRCGVLDVDGRIGRYGDKIFRGGVGGEISGKSEHGMRSGPMNYISKGADLPWLGWMFAVFTTIATFGIGNMTQANATAKIFESTFHIPTWMTGVVLMVFSALVILDGIKSIGKFTSLLVPFMIFGYVGSAL